MLYVIAYVSALVVLGVMDAVWLGLVGPILYKPTLSDILAPSVRLGPAIAFYLLYPVGIVIFAVLPTLRADSVVTAMGYGLLFGAFAYGTYDLTNFATLRNWTMTITVVDIAYGAVVSAAAAAAAHVATRAWLG